MQRTLTQDEPQLAESFCLVCEACVQVSSGVDIFYTSLPRNGELLASCVLRVLRPVASDLRSSYICGRCHNLFQILEQAQWAVSNITSEILKVYHSRDSEKLTDQTIRLAEDDSAQHLFIPASIVDEKGGVNDNTLNEIASMSNEFFNPANNNEEAIEALNNERLSVVKLEEINETKTGVGQYKKQCGVCNRLFKSAKDLQMHLLKHGGSRPYKCQRCDERFSDFGVASNHAIEVHFSKINCIVVAKEPMPNEIFDFSGEDSIAPESSQESAIVDSNSGQIENEKKKRKKKCDDPAWSSRKELEHVCSICGKKWRTLTELKSHVKSHSELRPYMCEKCGQAYKHKGALEIHVGMHSGVSPFQCSVCSKCFTQKGALMRHLPMHTGETPYQCELCGKRFVHHTSYNMHSLSHTGKKSYQCHVCDLSLLSTSHLKRHMRAHTGEKPYSCELCGKNFAERYNLFAHRKIHDPVEIMAKAAKKLTYTCDQCCEVFHKKQKLEDHAKQHHQDESLGSLVERKWIDYASQSKQTNDSLIEDTWQDVNFPKIDNNVDRI